MSKKLPTPAVADRYSKSPKTLGRWVELGIIPRPKYINGYKFWDEAELDACDNARGQGTPRSPVAAGGRGQPRKSTISKELRSTSAEGRKTENAELSFEQRVRAAGAAP